MIAQDFPRCKEHVYSGRAHLPHSRAWLHWCGPGASPLGDATVAETQIDSFSKIEDPTAQVYGNLFVFT